MSDFHGRFIWYELMTPDTAAAKAFYGSLVGWTTADMQMEGMTYTLLQAGGLAVGGMMDLTPDLRSQGIPPNWTAYVAVDDCDATADRVKRLGGAVLHEPQDIPEVGRFAVIADPAGAVLAVMAPSPTDPPRPSPPPNARGHAGWHELYGADPGEGFGFYAELFGWTKADVMDMGEMGAYQLFNSPDGQIGGMMRKPPQVPTPAWIYYFRVGGINAAARQVRQAGAQVLMGPMEVPGGDWVLQGVDPQGAVFALLGVKD